MWPVFAAVGDVLNYLKNTLHPLISGRATQTSVNTVSTNVGSNADVTSASGSVHAKLKYLAENSALLLNSRPQFYYISGNDTAVTYTVVNITGQGLAMLMLSRASTYTGADVDLIVDGQVLTNKVIDVSNADINIYGGSQQLFNNSVNDNWPISTDGATPSAVWIGFKESLVFKVRPTAATSLYAAASIMIL